MGSKEISYCSLAQGEDMRMASQSSQQTDAVSSREKKQNLILRQLRKVGQSTRLELAQELGISKSHTRTLVNDMVEAGMAEEDHSEGESRRGRGGIAVSLNPDFQHFVGFDMEASVLRMVVADFSGTSVWQHEEKFSPVHTRQDVINAILSFISENLATV